MSELASWLEPRLASVPVALRNRIMDAIGTENDSRLPLHAALCTPPRGPAPRSPLSSQLSQMAEKLLESVKNARDGAVALDLLAADALITYACEALSERDPDGLAEIA